MIIALQGVTLKTWLYWKVEVMAGTLSLSLHSSIVEPTTICSLETSMSTAGWMAMDNYPTSALILILSETVVDIEMQTLYCCNVATSKEMKVWVCIILLASHAKSTMHRLATARLVGGNLYIQKLQNHNTVIVQLNLLHVPLYTHHRES